MYNLLFLYKTSFTKDYTPYLVLAFPTLALIVICIRLASLSYIYALQIAGIILKSTLSRILSPSSRLFNYSQLVL